jgi:hypothetical protein
LLLKQHARKRKTASEAKKQMDLVEGFFMCLFRFNDTKTQFVRIRAAGWFALNPAAFHPS